MARWLLVTIVLVATLVGSIGLIGSRADAVAPRVDASALCDGLAALDVDDVLLCTHGPDQAPAAASSNGAGPSVPRRSAPCIGDGWSGQRVRVLYVHDRDDGAASSGLRADIERWVEQVEWTVWTSAREHGGYRQVRWRMFDCDLQITSQPVSSSALADFDTMVGELRDRGYRGSDHTYLLFVNASTYCGIATAPRDDSPSDNRADRIAGYARVDRGCWDSGDKGYHSIAAHELLHTLGAVQASAPHGTSGAHCTEEHDLLCYDDGTGGGTHTVCRDSDSSTYGAGDHYDRLLDCRGNDYFNPSPPSGSYLDGHWNTADSARLHDPRTSASDDAGPPSPTEDPVAYVLYLVFGD